MLEKDEEFSIENKNYITFAYTPSHILKNALIFQKDFLNNQFFQKELIIRQLLELLLVLFQNDYIYTDISASKILISKDLREIKFFDFKYKYYYGNNPMIDKLKKHLYTIQTNKSEAEINYFKSIGFLIFRILFNEDLPKNFNQESFIKNKKISIKYKDLLKNLLDGKIQVNIKIDNIKMLIKSIDKMNFELINNGFFLKNFGHENTEDFLNKLEDVYIKKYPIKIKLGDSLYSNSKSSLLQMIKPNTSQIVLKKYKLEKFQYFKCKKAVEKEIKNLLLCRNNLNIIQVNDIFKSKDSSSLFLVMEFCNGNTLKNYIANFKERLKLNDRKHIASDLALAIHFLHSKNIIHKDLRPESILLVLDQNKMLEKAKLSDLGLARNILKHQDKTKIIQTGSYRSPEMYKKYDGNLKIKITKASDIYSYGLILFYLLYGIEAYKLEDNLKDRSAFLRGCGKMKLSMSGIEFDFNAEELISLCLKESPEERITIEEILNHPFLNNFPLCYYNIQQQKYDSFVVRNFEEAQSTKLKLYYSNPKEKLWIIIYTNRIFHKIKIRKYLLEEILIIERINKNNVPFFTRLIYYNCSENDNPVEIYEFRNGYSLEDFIKFSETKIFSFKEMQIVFYCTLKCLESLYKLNYVHRNVYPKNILLDITENANSKEISLSYLNKIRIQGAKRLEENSKSIFEFLDNKFKILILDEKYDLMCLGMIIFYMCHKYIPLSTKSDSTFEDIFQKKSHSPSDKLISFCFDFSDLDLKKPFEKAQELNLV